MLKSRVLMFTASSLWMALLLVVLVFRGGGAVPRPADEPRAIVPVERVAQQAAILADRGDYDGAGQLYDQALQTAPENVSLWYALGVARSYLDQRQGTEEAFQYVVRHGDPASDEVKNARRWLVSAGVLAPFVTFTAPSEGEDAGRASGAVKGKVTWGEPAPTQPPLKIQMLLHGVDGMAKGKRFVAHATLGQPYRFEHLPAGSYRLIGRAGEHLLWDLAVTVQADKDITLDLGKDESPNPTIELFL